VESDLTHFHRFGLFEIGPHGVHHLDTLQLVPFNRIGFDEQGTLLNDLFGYLGQIHRCAETAHHRRWYPEVNVCGGQIVHVEPQILGIAKLDQILILKFVFSHVDDVFLFTVIGRGVEIENHG